MKLFAPDYYKNFSCIASSCRHNCCIGWEIDIDDDTYEYYKSIGGSFGKRLSENISEEGCPHFVLGRDERCPFLNAENLCDIICGLGEESLCSICNDHPRYRSFYTDIEEIGTGLSCEASAKLIVSKKDKTVICEISADDENEPYISQEERELFSERQRIFDILQNRTARISERLSDAVKAYIPDFSAKPYTEYMKLYRDLEYMESEWKETVTELSETEYGIQLPQEFDTAFEQIAVYFVYRHMSGILDGFGFYGTLIFCIVSTAVIMLVCRSHFEKHGSLSEDDIAEYARMYSCEIEYSEENTEYLKNLFSGEYPDF